MNKHGIMLRSTSIFRKKLVPVKMDWVPLPRNQAPAAPAAWRRAHKILVKYVFMWQCVSLGSNMICVWFYNIFMLQVQYHFTYYVQSSNKFQYTHVYLRYWIVGMVAAVPATVATVNVLKSHPMKFARHASAYLAYGHVVQRFGFLSMLTYANEEYYINLYIIRKTIKYRPILFRECMQSSYSSNQLAFPVFSPDWGAAMAQGCSYAQPQHRAQFLERKTPRFSPRTQKRFWEELWTFWNM